MKSKQNIRILMGLMSLALIGVMVIQFLWIRNAIRLKQEQFDRSVNMAMIRVSADLENKYGVHFITEQLEKDSAAKKEVMKKAPGFYKFMISVDDENQNAEADPGEDTVEGTTVNISCNGGDSYKTMAHSGYRSANGSTIAMVNTNTNIKHQVVISKSVLNEASAIPAVVEPQEAWPPVQVKTNLIKLVNNVADAYEISKMSPQDVNDVIDSQKIYTAIRKEFAKQELPQNFEFATYCVQGDTLMINKNSAAASNPLKDYTYKSPLLASDFIEPGTLLLINFPAHFRYIFSSLAGMLLLSLGFTLTIVSAFIYSLMVIFRQKKLSDITNDFINNMTHELKTPLATISMTADTLGLSTVNHNAEMVNEYSGMIKNEVKKLSRHVDRILEAAVMEKNGKPATTEVINLNVLIREEVKIFEPLIEKEKGKIEAAIPAETMSVVANKDLFRGAICNLMDNAVKYSKEVPEIKITLNKVGERALLTVEDKGIGISKGDQKLVFEKFFRAGTGNVHNVKGFGLGLSFVKTVVENMGGKVDVDSEPGKGSKFFIEIPLV